MIPEYEDDITLDFKIQERPGKTWVIDFEGNRLRNIEVDGLEAMPQAIFLALETPRYKHAILSWNYGSELQDCIGKPVPLVYVQIKNAITEALLIDDRITGVTNFSFTRKRGKISVLFTVKTIYGSVEAGKEMS